MNCAIKMLGIALVLASVVTPPGYASQDSGRGFVQGVDLAVHDADSPGSGIKSVEVSSRASDELLLILSSGGDVHISQDIRDWIEHQFRFEANRDTILLAGLARVDAVAGDIETLADRQIVEPDVGSFYNTPEWAANLILARQGDGPHIRKLLDFAAQQDQHTQVTVVLGDLQYVPQPEIVDFIRQYLDSDDRLDPVKTTVAGQPVATYAAASLARILRGFPVNYREDYSYSDEDIAACRRWMSERTVWEYK